MSVNKPEKVNIKCISQTNPLNRLNCFVHFRHGRLNKKLFRTIKKINKFNIHLEE